MGSVFPLLSDQICRKKIDHRSRINSQQEFLHGDERVNFSHAPLQTTLERGIFGVGIIGDHKAACSPETIKAYSRAENFYKEGLSLIRQFICNLLPFQSAQEYSVLHISCHLKTALVYIFFTNILLYRNNKYFLSFFSLSFL